MSCISCTQAITQQKTNDQKVIHIAQQKANTEQRTVGLYRDEEGNLCIIPDTGGTYPACMFINPQLQ